MTLYELIVPDSYMVSAWAAMLHSMVRSLKRLNTAASLWSEQIKCQDGFLNLWITELIISSITITFHWGLNTYWTYIQ